MDRMINLLFQHIEYRLWSSFLYANWMERKGQMQFYYYKVLIDSERRRAINSIKIRAESSFDCLENKNDISKQDTNKV